MIGKIEIKYLKMDLHNFEIELFLSLIIKKINESLKIEFPLLSR